MNDQGALFDLDDGFKPWQRGGVVLRDEAIKRVDENADVGWKDEARKAVFYLASTRPEFTADDVWGMLDITDAKTHEPRAMGAVMQAAAREGLIVATNRTVQSALSRRHARPVRVWRSLMGGID